MTSVLPVGDSDQRRQSVRSWLTEHPEPTPRDLAEAGYVAPHWPAPWGLGADAMTQLIIEDELQRAGKAIPVNPNAFLFIGPSLLIGGTQEQRDRYLMPMLAGEELWCRLYSEPEAGSDLTAIRTRAERRGDVYVVNGGKIWAPLAQNAVLGGLLVRSSGTPGDRDGLTYLICPMDSPGITLRPVRDFAGGYRFNELFFDNVEIPATNLVGVQDAGLDIAMSRERFERVTTARGVMFGNGPGAPELLRFASNLTGLSRRTTDRLTDAYIESELVRMMAMTIAGERQNGRDTRSAERARKILLERHGQALGYLANELRGNDAMLAPPADDRARSTWHNMFLSAASLTIGAGATETQLDELGSLLLGT